MDGIPHNYEVDLTDRGYRFLFGTGPSGLTTGKGHADYKCIMHWQISTITKFTEKQLSEAVKS